MVKNTHISKLLYSWEQLWNPIQTNGGISRDLLAKTSGKTISKSQTQGFCFQQWQKGYSPTSHPIHGDHNLQKNVKYNSLMLIKRSRQVET